MAKKVKKRGSMTDAHRKGELSVSNLLPLKDPKARRFLQTISPIITGWRLLGVHKFYVATLPNDAPQDPKTGKKPGPKLCVSQRDNTSWLTLHLDEESYDMHTAAGFVGADKTVMTFDTTMATIFDLVMTTDIDGFEMAITQDNDMVVASLVPVTNAGYKIFKQVVLANRVHNANRADEEDDSASEEEQ